MIDIEEEVVRKSRKRKSSKKADKSVLDEKKKEQNRDLQQKNHRGPAPLPKSAAYFAGKKKEQNQCEIKIAVEEFPSEENNLQSMDFDDSPEYVITSVNGQHTDVDYSDKKKEESKSVLDSGKLLPKLFSNEGLRGGARGGKGGYSLPPVNSNSAIVVTL